MPTCETCGEDDQFENVDGLYYCVVCHTQSQDIRDEEMDDEGFGPGGSRMQSSLIISKSTSGGDGEKKKKELDLGRPWHFHEVYQLILMEQVKALIKLGASSHLKTVVFKLWTYYLSKTGIAFCKEEDKAKRLNAAKVKLSRRDKYPGTMANPRIFYRRKDQGLTKKMALKLQERELLRQTLGEETFYEGDNPFEAEDEEEGSIDSFMVSDSEFEDFETDTDSSESDEESDPGLDPEKVDSAKRNKLQRRIRISRMTRNLTIAFMRLGLYYTNGLISSSDLYRWIKSGELPYQNAMKLLPKDIKFQGQESQIFTMMAKTVQLSKIRPHKINVLTAKLAVYLDATDIPPVPLDQMASRFLLELGLPDEFHALVRNLVKMFNINPALQQRNGYFKIIPNYEEAAMAHVIIALKLLFGVNDVAERTLSFYARELSSKVQLKQPLFIWEYWIREIIYHQWTSLSSGYLPKNLSEVQRCHDVSKCATALQEVAVDFRYYSAHYGLPKCKVSYREDFCKAVSRPFQTLFEKLKLEQNEARSRSNQTQSQAVEESLDFHPGLLGETMETDDYLDELLNNGIGEFDTSSHWVPGHSESTREGFSNDRLEVNRDCSFNFRHCSLRYITEAEDFLENLDNADLSEFMLSSSCAESDNASSSEELDPSQDMFASPKAKKQKKFRQQKHPTLPSSIAASVIQHMQETVNEEIEDGDIGYSFVHSLMRPYEKYHMYEGKKASGQWPKAYRDLLDVCSSHIFSKSDNLHTWVKRLECSFLKTGSSRRDKLQKRWSQKLCH